MQIRLERFQNSLVFKSLIVKRTLCEKRTSFHKSVNNKTTVEIKELKICDCRCSIINSIKLKKA